MPLERTYKALLIGNGAYSSSAEDLSDLFGPANDVAGMAAALSDAEWGLHNPAEVIRLVDATKSEIERVTEEFFAGASVQDQLLFYYSGHGLHEVHERLFLAASDSRSDRPLSSAIAVQFLNDLAGTTRAEGIALILDCCYSGIMKGPTIASALDSRGRWTLTSSSRNQQSRDAMTSTSMSAFTELVCEALVANAEVDADADGFVTMADISRYVTPRLQETTGQTATFKFEGSGELVVALAPGYPVDVDQSTSWASTASGARASVPAVPPVVGDGADVADTDPPEEGTSLRRTVVDLVGTNENELVDATLDALEAGRTITVRRLLQQTTRDASRLVETEDAWDQLADVLDRLTCLTAAFLNHRQTEWFDQGVRELARIYEQGFDAQGLTKTDARIAGGVSPAELWVSLIQRVISLGGLAVRLEDWRSVKELALQRPDGYDFRHYDNWVRHAVTMGSRGNLFRVEVNGAYQETSLLVSARDYISVHECLTPDLDQRQSERVLESLCQFDALACIAALALASDRPTESKTNFYPSFSRFRSDWTEPVFRALISDREMRDVIAPVSDIELARVYRRLSSVASNEGYKYVSGWSGINSPETQDWLEKTESSGS